MKKINKFAIKLQKLLTIYSKNITTLNNFKKKFRTKLLSLEAIYL